MALVLQLGKFNWTWIFLILIPILGWIVLAILAIIFIQRIYEKKYSGWFSLLGFVPQIGGILYLVVLGFVA